MQSLFIFRESMGRMYATGLYTSAPRSPCALPPPGAPSQAKKRPKHTAVRAAMGVSGTGQLFSCHSCEISGSLGERFRFSAVLSFSLAPRDPSAPPSLLFFYTDGNCSSAPGVNTRYEARDPAVGLRTLARITLFPSFISVRNSRPNEFAVQ